MNVAVQTCPGLKGKYRPLLQSLQFCKRKILGWINYVGSSSFLFMKEACI